MRDPWETIERLVDKTSKLALIAALVTFPILMLLHYFGIHN